MTAILDVFGNPHRRHSLTDIARQTGLATSTAHRILEQLVHLGWVEHSAGGYRLGWRAQRLSFQVDRTAVLRAAAAPFVQELATRTPFIVHLGVLDGPYVRYLDKVGGREKLRVPSRVGGLLPAHLTAVGKAMLAYVETETLEATLEAAAATGGVTSVDSGALYSDLASIRTRGGLSTERNSPLAAVACVGAPIFDGSGQVAGALSLCGGGRAASLEQFAPLLRERARRISARMSRCADLMATTAPGPPSFR